MRNPWLAAFIAALLPWTAGADLADWYVSGGMLYIDSDSDRTADEDYAPFIGVGRIFGNRYSLEFEYNAYDFDLGTAGEVLIDGFNLRGNYYFLGNSKTSPYVGLGIGSLDSDSPFGSGGDPHFDIAGGVRWQLGDGWGLRGQMRYRFDGDDDALPAAEDFGDWMLSIGVTIALARRPPPAPPRPRQEPEPVAPMVPKTTFTLLPDDDGQLGKVVISNDAGEEEISRAGYSIRVASAGVAPEKPEKADEEQLKKVFGDALEVFPEPPAHYQLYFQFDSTDLTADSKKLVPQIVAVIKKRNSVDISVVGHSDTAGNNEYNLKLSSHRAKATAELLVEMGVREDIIEITSHGENNPAYPTADNVQEPRNRRAEVTIR